MKPYRQHDLLVSLAKPVAKEGGSLLLQLELEVHGFAHLGQMADVGELVKKANYSSIKIKTTVQLLTKSTEASLRCSQSVTTILKDVNTAVTRQYEAAIQWQQQQLQQQRHQDPHQPGGSLEQLGQPPLERGVAVGGRHVAVAAVGSAKEGQGLEEGRVVVLGEAQDVHDHVLEKSKRIM